MYGINLNKVIIPKITLSKYTLKEVSLSSKSNNIPYIKNGLVFWLDGINKGPNNDKWTDLIGGIQFNKTTSTIEGENYFKGRLNSSSIVYYSVSNATIEFVINNPILLTSNVLWFNCGQSNGICGGTAHNDLLISHATCITYNESSLNDLGFHTISANKNLLVHNLNTDTQVSGNDLWNLRGNQAIINPEYKNVEIYSIRIYNRLLTEEEMKHNQLVDIMRFNLPEEERLLLENGNYLLLEQDNNYLILE